MSDPDGEREGIARGGRFMLTLGWLAVIALVTLAFNGYLNSQRNPNTEATLRGQQGPLVLDANAAGMYLAEGRLNGQWVEYMLDTGATYVAVPLDVAEAAGLQPGRKVTMQTANGETHGWMSDITHLQIGQLELRDVTAVIVEALDGPVLLGMSALSELRMEQSPGRIVLEPARGY